MAKIKLTKTELKAQRDALKQFTRFLPTLLLKKQQLQLEMRRCQEKLDNNREKEADLRRKLSDWIALFSQDNIKDKLLNLIKLEGVESETHNIAGVDIPVFKSIRFTIGQYDLFIEDAWIDDAILLTQKLIELKEERNLIEKEYQLIKQELRVTTQRVNLFEKVKIPECKESIRIIQIYLGDRQTAAVGRAKTAKAKMQDIYQSETAA